MALPTVASEFRLATEPELRFSQSGTAVVKMRLVASSQKKQEDGTWKDERTVWLGATAFGQLAEHIADTFDKGDLVIVTGRLVTEEWEKDGQKRSEVRLIVDAAGPSIRFRQIPHGSGREEGQAPRERASSPAPVRQAQEGGSSPQGGAEQWPPF